MESRISFGITVFMFDVPRRHLNPFPRALLEGTRCFENDQVECRNCDGCKRLRRMNERVPVMKPRQLSRYSDQAVGLTGTEIFDMPTESRRALPWVPGSEAGASHR